MDLTENLGGTSKNGLNRRRFLKGMAATAGLGIGASILAACGDSPTNTAAPIPTTAAATTAASTTAAAAATTTTAATTAAATTTAATTAAPTTAASTTVAATTAAPTTAAPTTAAASTTAATSTTSAAATTSAAGASGTAPAGYVQVGKLSTTTTAPVGFTSGTTKGYVYSKSASEVFVYSNICTHMGCEVPAYKADAKEFMCPCHGSTFTNTGEVISGPARTRLPLFDNKVVGDVIYAKLS